MFEDRYKNGEIKQVIICDCCHNEIGDNDHITEHYNDDMGFIRMGNMELHICKECKDKAYYRTEYGFTFIKALDQYTKEQALYLNMCDNLWGSFERVRHERQIEEAFNSDRCNFGRWLRL